MGYVWAGMMGISLIFSLFSGTSGAVSDTIMSGAQTAVELVFSILGVLCFWSGMMEIGKRSGICDLLGRIFSPLLSLIYRDVERDSPAMKYISLNISANMLGLGNAATPFGIEAMKELQKINPRKDTASDSMLIFVVMNTASMQLFPTTLGAYRANYGSAEPFSILSEIWITSLVAMTVGIAAAKCLAGAKRKDAQWESKISVRRRDAWR